VFCCPNAIYNWVPLNNLVNFHLFSLVYVIWPISISGVLGRVCALFLWDLDLDDVHITFIVTFMTLICFSLVSLNIGHVSNLFDRLCSLVVRVLGYRSGDPGSIPGTTKKK
jgi:hypothetical protein